MESTLDTTKIDNLEFDDVDTNDYPDFTNSYVSSADYNGVAMTEQQLDLLNDNYEDFVYEQLIINM